ncbi:MAG: hypothetical protein M1294_09785 [Firmicutes bacterium]|nr:hypothetical protein [Bacillota bacterium]
MSKPDDAVATLRNDFIAGEIDTEDYLKRIDAIQKNQQSQAKKQMIPTGAVLVGDGIATAIFPGMAVIEFIIFLMALLIIAIFLKRGSRLS